MASKANYICSVKIGLGSDTDPYRPKFADFDSVMVWEQINGDEYYIIADEHTELLSDPDIEVI